MTEQTMAQRDKLLADMREVLTDAEELVRLSADDASEGTRVLRDRLQGNLMQVRGKLAELQGAAAQRLKVAGHAADDFVHDNPWRSIAIGTGLGLLVGVLIGRR